MKSAAPGSAVRIALVTAGAVYLLLLGEWLFQVTKPSMFSVRDWPERITILLAAALFTALPVALTALIMAFGGSRLGERWARGGVAAALAIPALVLTATGFLLVENFTRTVFGFNVGSFTSPVRYLYAVGGLLLAVFLHGRLRRRHDAPSAGRSGAIATAALLLVASVAAAWARYEPRQRAAPGESGSGEELPNILIFSSDGLNAASMSVYGYEVDTTPFLASRADEFLVSENHFSNSSDTAASIGALLSGKTPLTTSVLQAGDVFSGEHVFRHLPGMLRQLGYYNIDVSARFYGDAYDMNIRQGFHVANGRSLRNETLPVLGWVGGAYPTEFYFVSLTLERLRERVLHAVGLVDMQDYFEVVAKRFSRWDHDARRLALLDSYLASAPRPFFAHVHLLDTHNVPRAQPGAEAGHDRYDDAVRRYDGYLQRMVTDLEAVGGLDRTVLIVNSDHDSERHGKGRYRKIRTRLPLLIRFPRAERAGRISQNTQRIDIAPTILSYLGLEPPDWMMGRSLIGGALEPTRLILGTGLRWRRSVRYLTLVQCQQAWEFRMLNASLERHLVVGHTAPCAEAELIGPEDARAYFLARMETSRRLALPFDLLVRSLLRDNNPQMREHVLETIRKDQVPSLWLGKTIAVARLHADYWTVGERPGVILLRNPGAERLPFELVVASGRQREFPASFSVQDEQGTREYTFAEPGFLKVDLGEVEPGGERLVVVRSASSWRPEGTNLSRGVRLLVGGAWLRGLLGDAGRAEWQRAARLILDRRVPTVRLAEGWEATNLHSDRWTRGDQPAGLALRNEGDRPLVRRLDVQSAVGHRFPLRFHLDDGERSHEYLFEGPGRLTVELPAVPPRSERLFIVRSERGWTPESRARRALGVRLSPL